MKKSIQRIFRKKYKTIHDDSFLKRIKATIIGEGMLHEGNIYLMDYAIRHMPDDGIVFEIGSYAGLSTNVMLHLLTKHDKKHMFVGCDAWIYEGFKDHTGIIETHIDGKVDVTRKEYVSYIKQAFVNAASLLHPNKKPHTCHLTSDAFFEQWNANNEFTDVFDRTFSIQQEISFGYIDGDHSYEQTKKDFENVASKLKVNGFILLDDSAKHLHFGSSDFIQEIQQHDAFKIIAHNPNYLLQKVKE
ncbi:methyltransferase domain protein [Kordia sp. SMS9]|uniref:class I SAM-dependent methyltransferase n=1 Tax=Kordia sp. SMS9 TaxID=2282170 RepID=UPI000E0D2424|nr:class I SAM-dependent methyltransferase [Kordia sp. SMS9]AXG69196.1 methyltransferase domain protein [Kordia sp. SMS9]